MFPGLEPPSPGSLRIGGSIPNGSSAVRKGRCFESSGCLGRGASVVSSLPSSRGMWEENETERWTGVYVLGSGLYGVFWREEGSQEGFPAGVWPDCRWSCFLVSGPEHSLIAGTAAPAPTLVEKFCLCTDILGCFPSSSFSSHLIESQLCGCRCWRHSPSRASIASLKCFFLGRQLLSTGPA